ncbi:MAG: efflux RND transporter periplasmic adaptor subunit [Bryobacteraceae bacterium]
MEPRTPNSHDAAPRTAQGGRFKVFLIALVVILLLGALLVLGYRPRADRARQLTVAAQTNQSALPSVTVAPVIEAPAEVEISLPGNIQAETETPIFARADGYIKQRTVDIGDRVKAGQLLAEIDSPELEQQIREAEAALRRSQSTLRQTEAALGQARANLGLAEITAKRWQTLVDKGVLSKQDGDEKQSVFDVRRADVAAAEANVQAARENIVANQAALQRLRELQAFRQVHAPFSGVITARNVDVGALVSSGSSTAIREMFRLAQSDVLRVFVNVPQSESPAIRPGLACSVEVEEYRSRRFPGKVSRTAGSLDPASRTLLTEVRIPNPDGALLPGMYATVHFLLRRQNPPLLIPSAAFRNTGKGPVVAVLAEGAVVRFVPVKLGRDFGAQIEVAEGLRPAQRIITNLTDEVREGVKVRPIAAAKPAAAKGGSVK